MMPGGLFVEFTTDFIHFTDTYDNTQPKYTLTEDWLPEADVLAMVLGWSGLCDILVSSMWDQDNFVGALSLTVLSVALQDL